MARAYGVRQDAQGNDIPEETNQQAADVKRKPNAAQVAEFHTNADTDVRPQSLHHTLGSSPNQASPGDHRHDGSTSAYLLEGVTLTGSRGNISALSSIIAALVQLGADDATTA